MKKWNICSSTTPKNLEELIHLLLDNRGIENEKKKRFLEPQIDDVSVLNVGIDEKQLKKSIKRIRDAVEKEETIVIFGDYDVDGVAGTAILWETIFWNLGYKKVYPYIPHRINEGYGISEKGIDSVLSDFPETQLIVTVDNGIVAHESVRYARSKGIQVIITDHHTPKETLPEAFSIVHTTKVCGASVALLLSLALEGKYLDVRDPRIDLAALATVADLVPLVDANRTILTFGLKSLRNSKRPGIKALAQISGIDQNKIGVYEIGHMIAPRLNAAGRLEHAMDSLRILCTRSAEKARMISQNLSEVNKQRQDITQEYISIAKQGVVFEESVRIIISVSSDYNQGIIGLIASRLAENYHRPALVISKGEVVSKGSARSIRGINVIELIRSASTYLTEAGGHPMAAGFALKTEHLELFAEEITKKAEDFIDVSYFERTISIDCVLDKNMIDENTYQSIQKLAPFGMGNFEPIFLTEGVEVISSKRIGKDLSHASLQLKVGDKKISAVRFGLDKTEKLPIKGQELKIVFVLSMNEWNGNKNLQLVIKDWS